MRAIPAETAPDIEVIQADRLESIREEWADLWRRSASTTPFQAPGWLLPWARHYAGDRCAAVTLRMRGRLSALLPAFTWRGSLLLAGTGPSDFGDGLFLPGTGAWAGQLVAALADGSGRSIRRIELRQLPPGSPLTTAAPPDGWLDTLEDDVACPVLDLRGQDGMEAVSARLRANWRYGSRRIERAGGDLECVPHEDAPDAIAALERLHAARWRQRGEEGALADPLLRRLLRDAVPDLAIGGLARLHRLRLGGRTAAVLLVLRDRRDAHYYLGGFDPACAALSPGTALVGHAIAQAAKEGAAAFHFLRGREAYKYRWGARDLRTSRRILTRA